MKNRIFIIFTALLILSAFSGAVYAEETVVRVAYFPNITHSQAIVGMADKKFQKNLGSDVKVIPSLFNAGPSVIEAMFAGQIDIAYIGPNPAINGYVKSNGEALRIIAGATSGGAGLVVRPDSGIEKIEDFHGKRIASPQLGNTQDVALRGWLKTNGFTLKEKGGDVQVLPISNPDQLNMFIKKEIDAAWTVEPWVSRIIEEGGGKIFLNESDLWKDGEFVTAHIIVSTKFLAEHPDIVKKWLSAHVDITLWINSNISEAKKIVDAELKRLTGKSLPPKVLASAFTRIKVTYDPIKDSLFKSAVWAYEEGFLGKKMPDLSGIYDLRILQDVLKEKNLPPIEI